MSSDNNNLIVISNRLPITIKQLGDGKFDYSMSSGGLVTGLSGLKKSQTFTWLGWTGLQLPENEVKTVTAELKEKYNAVPVWIADDIMDAHYNGFSNSILWPLFHYHPNEVSFNESYWEGYIEANRQFAKAVISIVKEGDTVWVHDYHLMLLPQFLREEIEQMENPVKHVKIGFFLHTPFPSSEIYRILPYRVDLLVGTLSCDLIGFHTYDYARHFLSSCARILGAQTSPNGLTFGERNVQVGVFPIGIDPDKFTDGLKEEKVQKRISELERKFDGVKVIIGVDRLDYIKGVQQKLHAFETFLERYPDWIGKVVLVQIAVPSRGDVQEYQNLRANINELVTRINGNY